MDDEFKTGVKVGIAIGFIAAFLVANLFFFSSGNDDLALLKSEIEELKTELSKKVSHEDEIRAFNNHLMLHHNGKDGDK